MKYKLLLIGNNKELISDFFTQMNDTFECISSSGNYEDLTRHLNCFSPDMVVYCPRDERRNDVASVSNFRDDLSLKNIPYAVIAGIGDYADVERMAAGKSKCVIKMPVSNPVIKNRLTGFLTEPSHQSSSTGGTLTGDSTLDMLAQIDAEMAGLGLGGSAPLPETEVLLLEPEYDKKRVLVVDDSTIVHRTINAFLDNQYEVATAINGKVALRFLKSKMVSLILLDYEMPDINGPELLVKIREYPELANIPVIFLTCINDQDKIQKAIKLKPQGYLLKPVEKDALIKKISELIG